MRGVALLLLAGVLGACAALSGDRVSSQDPALQALTAEALGKDIAVLASDRFGGRLPGTAGEDLTVDYLVAAFKEAGLQPGNPDGSWVQSVPLVGITGTPRARFRAGGKKLSLRHRHDYVAVTSRFQPEVSIANSELVFVGYGVQAPEFDWDDYKGMDLRGKTLVVLINDPAVRDPQDSSQLDATVFKGSAMTYYGRWTYKYEIASKLGAAAAMVVHETEPASYGWEVVRNSWTGEQFELAAEDGNRSRVPVQGWISLEKTREIFSAAGKDFDALKAQALRRDFRPVPLDATLTLGIQNRIRHVQSRNVIARLPGADASVAKEHLIYTAHWDHLGTDPGRDGDQIFNGALDNATGTAGLLGLARAYAKLAVPPRRSILFLAVTAEEQGLLGSRRYAQNPLYPLEQTLAVINMDGLPPWGPTTDIEVVGWGQSSLEDTLGDVLKARGRHTVPDTHPEKGFYFRSDHFEFAKEGVPGLYAARGSKVIGRPAGYGEQKLQTYIAEDYHNVSDEMKADWDLSGSAENLRALLEVGVRVADAKDWPVWKDGSEFKAIREAALQASIP